QVLTPVELRRQHSLSTRRSIGSQTRRPVRVDVYALHDNVSLVWPRQRGGSGRTGTPMQEDQTSQYKGCNRRQSRKTADLEQHAEKSHSPSRVVDWKGSSLFQSLHATPIAIYPSQRFSRAHNP